MEIKVKTNSGETRTFRSKEPVTEKVITEFTKIHEGSIKSEGWVIVEPKVNISAN